MKDQNFTTTLLVDQSPEEVFRAVTNVRGWWSEDVEGGTDKLNDEFLYYYKDVHISKMRITELIPGKKVVWDVLKNHFSFTSDHSEWTGTKVIFEISNAGSKTELRFTHLGLVPEFECYNICLEGWGNYINKSLNSLITTGKGQPNPKEGGFNAGQVVKWKLK